MNAQAKPRSRTPFYLPKSIETLRECGLVPEHETNRLAREIEQRIEPAYLNNVDRPLEGWVLVTHANGERKLHNAAFKGALDTIKQGLICELLSDVSYDRLSVSYQAQHRLEQEAARFEKARKVAMAEWSGPLFLGDNYFGDVDDLMEAIANDYEAGDELPEYAYASRKVEPVAGLSAARLADHLYDELSNVEGMEDWTFKGLAELQQAVDDFAATNSDCVYYEADFQTAILLDLSGLKLD